MNGYAAATVPTVLFFKYFDFWKTQPAPVWNALTFWHWVSQFIQGHQNEIIFWLLITQSAARLILWAMQSVRPFDRTLIEKALNDIVSVYMEVPDGGDAIYRATLFKKRSCPGIGQWLGAAARSGNTNRCRSIWSIDTSEVHKNTGMAGKCWHSGGFIKLTSIPTPTDAGTHKNQVHITQYCSATHMTFDEYKNLKIESSFFVAVCVKIGGKPWGVLVLDSTESQASKIDEASLKASINHTTRMLTLILEAREKSS